MSEEKKRRYRLSTFRYALLESFLKDLSRKKIEAFSLITGKWRVLIEPVKKVVDSTEIMDSPEFPQEEEEEGL